MRDLYSQGRGGGLRRSREGERGQHCQRERGLEKGARGGPTRRSNAVIHPRKTNIAGVPNLPPDAKRAIDELRLIGGEELVREMVTTFSRFATSAVARLGEASDAGSLDQVASFAQALHASARQMGATRLAEAAASAEVAARGQDAGGVANAIEHARGALTDARAWLDELAAS